MIGHIDNLDSCTTDACNVTILVNETADDHEFLFCSGSAANRKLYFTDHKSNTVFSMAYTGGNITAVVNVTRPIGVSTTLLQSPTTAPTQPQPSHAPTSPAPSLEPTTNYSTMYWTHKEERWVPRALVNAHTPKCFCCQRSLPFAILSHSHAPRAPAFAGPRSATSWKRP